MPLMMPNRRQTSDDCVKHGKWIAVANEFDLALAEILLFGISNIKQRKPIMTRKLSTLRPNVVRILVAVGTLAMFVLSAGAPHGMGG